MPSERQELMLRIIDLCDTVRKRGLDPFDVEVREFFDRLRELLPKLRKHEELYLDIQAVLGLADVVFQQGEWIKHKSSMLYLDPLLIMLKLHALPAKDLAEVLTHSWHPIIDLEALTPHGVKEGLDYWRNLPPLDERWRGLDTTEVLTGEIARRELARMGILSDEDFAAVMDRAWRELKDAAGDGGEISYWDFISERSFEETVVKAWLVSFLVSYGYATLEIKSLEEDITLRPLPKPQRLECVTTSSVPISISREEWLQRRRARG
ncbi:MAG: hypothetical protein QMD95_02580 [Candidatus Hodarchaeaceae archaeon]|nr:hypothetical protein [Candidatus Hodarchaeaceae archaeon]